MSELKREQLLMSVIAGRGPAYLRGVDLAALNLSGAGWLSEADLRGADLSNANLRRANLRGANLEMANMHSATLVGTNLEGANLFRVKASVANLNMANLRGTNLKEANLVGATFVRAELEGADLDGADLEGANLEGSSLRKARITNANLKMTNLSGADLTEAVLEGNNGIADRAMEGEREDFHGTITAIGLADLLQIGCLSRSSLNIEVYSGGDRGNIYIGSGRVLHAHAGGMEGEEALMNILGWEKGHFITYPSIPAGLVSIDKPVEHLLLQWHRLQDEKRFSGECSGLVRKMKKCMPLQAQASNDLVDFLAKEGTKISTSEEIEITDVFHAEGDEDILCSISTNGQTFVAPLKLLSLEISHPLYSDLASVK